MLIEGDGWVLGEDLNGEALKALIVQHGGESLEESAAQPLALRGGEQVEGVQFGIIGLDGREWDPFRERILAEGASADEGGDTRFSGYKEIVIRSGEEFLPLRGSLGFVEGFEKRGWNNADVGGLPAFHLNAGDGGGVLVSRGTDGEGHGAL